MYLGPLIDDLKLLWNEGVKVFDAATGTHFNLRAMLLCTLQDYPVIGNVLGWPVKCKTGCPCCEDQFEYTRLNKAKKVFGLVIGGGLRLIILTVNCKRLLMENLNSGTVLECHPV